MYWTGQVGGPDGENFSFYLEWVSIEDKFVKQDDGFLIVIKPASGTVKLWVTPETMRSIAEQHEAFRVSVKALRAEIQLRRNRFNSIGTALH